MFFLVHVNFIKTITFIFIGINLTYIYFKLYIYIYREFGFKIRKS